MYLVGAVAMPRTFWTLSTLCCCCCCRSSKCLRSMQTVSFNALAVFFSDKTLSERSTNQNGFLLLNCKRHVHAYTHRCCYNGYFTRKLVAT